MIIQVEVMTDQQDAVMDTPLAVVVLVVQTTTPVVGQVQAIVVVQSVVQVISGQLQ